MPMKVEIFQEAKANELQTLINDWLGKHPNIRVDHITQSQIQHGEHMSMPITICIWYTERS
jgi:hypothetical protein